MKAELVDRIRLAWIVLSEADDPSPGALTTRPLVETGPGELLLGRDAAGVPCLLVPVVAPGPEESVGVITVRNRELATAEGARIFTVISCLDPSLRDVFDHLLVNVVAALETAPEMHPGAVAIRVLADWRQLFRGGVQTLGPSELAALLAELLVVEEVVARDRVRSLAVWRGPSEARHDLRRGDHAIEVKSTLSHTGRRITVHGIDQLEAPTGGSLTLAWHRFEEVPDGPLSVFTVADRLIANGVSAVELHSRLEGAGSPPSTRDIHDAVRFKLRERRFFPVDRGFPRLIAETFPSGVPEGVDDIIYKVTLPEDEVALDAAGADAVLTRLGGGS